MRYRRRECIPDLPILRCLLASESPFVRKTLQPGSHADCKLGKMTDRDVGRRRRIRHASAIYPQFTPGGFRARGTKIGTAMEF